jgi:hypothetical protein
MVDVLTELRSLADSMGFADLNIYGPRDDGANSSPPGIWWRPETEKWTLGQHRGSAGDPSGLWAREIPVRIVIFGGENADVPQNDQEPSVGAGTFAFATDKTEALLELVVNAFQRRCSQQSYQIIDGGWGPASRTGIGLSYDVVVQLRLPLVRIDNPTVKLMGIKLEKIDFETQVSNV